MAECFCEDDLGVGDEDDLRSGLGGQFAEQDIDLALSQDFEVGIRFIYEQDAARMRMEVGEDQQHLLEAPPGERDVERSLGTFLLVLQLDAAAGRLSWGGEFSPGRAAP